MRSFSGPSCSIGTPHHHGIGFYKLPVGWSIPPLNPDGTEWLKMAQFLGFAQKA